MEISTFDYIANASDEALMKMAELIQTEQRKREEQKEEAKQKYYTFSGTWSWGCWATSEKEAWDKFNDSYIEDFDLDYGHTQMEVDD